MRRLMSVLGVLMLVLAFGVPAQGQVCATIQNGTITDSAGQAVGLGYDLWGYNYQAHMFNGYYDNYSRPTVPVTSGDDLEMKWNDAWLSNQDCDLNGQLDRHFGFPTYKGSGAWLTNHQKGVYLDLKGKKQRWEYFVKIVAAPSTAVLVDGKWAMDGIEIGPAIWGEFAIVQEVYNDTGTGDHGVLYRSPYSVGFGSYGPK